MRRNLFSSSFKWTSPCISAGGDCLVDYPKPRCVHKILALFATAGVAGGGDGGRALFRVSACHHTADAAQQRRLFQVLNIIFVFKIPSEKKCFSSLRFLLVLTAPKTITFKYFNVHDQWAG
jgi:hypothetical protein